MKEDSLFIKRHPRWNDTLQKVYLITKTIHRLEADRRGIDPSAIHFHKAGTEY